jgi:hypothetical protein
MVQRALLVILLLGLVGTGVELLLLRHTDGFWQWAPLALIGAALVALAWVALSKSRASLRAFDAIMLVSLASGAAGVWLHFAGNMEWERERAPGLGGMTLVRLALMGATPTLAPGTMLQLGLVGLLYSYVRRRDARGVPAD